MFARSGRRVPTIRVLAHSAVAASVLVTVLVAVGLIGTSARLESATETMFSNAQSFALAREAQIALLMYQRISNLYTVTPDAELDEARLEMLDELRRTLGSTESFVGSDDEQRLLGEIATRLDAYLEERSLLEARNVPIDEMLRQTQSTFDQVVDALDRLHDMNQEELLSAQSDAIGWNRLVSVYAGAAVVVLVCGVLAVLAGFNRAVLRPILALHETITRFRAGSADARACATGLHEVRELALVFNEMADALAKQRESQLAFLAGVAHDLKNPLQALRFGIHALAAARSRAEHDRTLDTLDRQVDRLERMVDDLLDATRIEAGKLEIRLEPFDLRVVVVDMIRLYAPTSPEHDLDAQLPAEPALVEGDPLRLEQVVSNLLSNAIKYSPRGGAVRVAVEASDGEVLLSVADEGIGIEPAQRAEIFLPFRPRKVDAPAGAGLGLSIVRRIVEAHGGRIEVESNVAGGTLFRVALKRYVPPQPAPGAQIRSP